MTTALAAKEILLDSAKEVFESMVFMALEEIGEDTADTADVTLLGTITFTGTLRGGLNVCCGLECARTIAANMLCMDSPDGLADEDVIDAIGEIANMVMGSVKTRVQDQVDIAISVPSVVQGRELRSRPTEGTTRTELNVMLAQEHRASFSLLYRESNSAG
jgi:chemotaxis protein CheX